MQFLYSLAILLSVPLQLFPAVRIMENGLFTRSGKLDWNVKWQKNTFRFLVVMGCTALSWAGAKDLDKFVAFVGSFAWYVLRDASKKGQPRLTFPPLVAYRFVTSTRQCFITKHVRVLGSRRLQTSLWACLVLSQPSIRPPKPYW